MASDYQNIMDNILNAFIFVTVSAPVYRHVCLNERISVLKTLMPDRHKFNLLIAYVAVFLLLYLLVKFPIMVINEYAPSSYRYPFIGGVIVIVIYYILPLTLSQVESSLGKFSMHKVTIAWAYRKTIFITLILSYVLSILVILSPLILFFALLYILVDLGFWVTEIHNLLSDIDPVLDYSIYCLSMFVVIYNATVLALFYGRMLEEHKSLPRQ